VPDLEQRLVELGQGLEWPATPRFRVEQLIPAPGEVGRPMRTTPSLPRWALAAAAALLIVAIALAAFPPSRTAIADWINLHVSIQKVQTLPTPTPLPSGALGSQLGLGLPFTLENAQRQVRWHIEIPADLGPPDAVYVRTLPAGGEVTLVYARAIGIPVAGETGVAVLVTEVRGTIRGDYFAKQLGQDATIEQVTVHGRPGYWLAGSPHVVMFQDASGEPVPDTLRLATNTLIYDSGDGTITRIEAYTTRERAIQIANSLPVR
jgi:hypothetical protein